MARDYLDDEVIRYATTMPGDAQSIQLKRPHKTTPLQRARREAIRRSLWPQGARNHPAFCSAIAAAACMTAPRAQRVPLISRRPTWERTSISALRANGRNQRYLHA